MTEPRRSGRLRWAGWSALLLASVVVVGAVGVFVALRMVDVPAVQARLEREVSQLAQGTVTWDSLELRLYPLPHGVLRGAHVDMPGVVRGGVDTVEVDLGLGALLTGQVRIDRVRLVRPKVSLVITPSPTPRPLPTDVLAAYRQAMAPVVDAVRKFAPALAVSIEDATLEIAGPGLPAPVSLRLAAEGRTDSSGIALAVTMAGPLLTSARVHASVAFADLAASASVDVRGLKPQPFLDRWLVGLPIGVQCPGGDLRIDAKTDGKLTIAATVDATLPAASLARSEAGVELSPVRVQASATALGRDVDIVLTTLQLGDIVPVASARLRFSGMGESAAASAEIPAVDLLRARDVALLFIEDGHPVRQTIERVRGGRATALRATATAPTLGGLVDASTFAVGLQVEDGAYLAPAIEREVTAIAGRVDWSGGALAVRGTTGRLDAATVTDASFDYRLDTDDMNIASAYDLDLAKTLVLVRPLLDAAQRSALARITALKGRATGTFGLALPPGSWKADVTILRSDASLRIREVPWPVTLSAGRVTVAPGRVEVTGARGKVGRSTFDAVGVDLGLRGPAIVDGARGSVRLVLDEVYPWLRDQKGIADALRDLPAITGAADVTVDRIAGRLDAVDALVYDLTVRPRQVSVTWKGLRAPVALDTGAIRVTPDAIRVDGVVVSHRDAQASLSGTLSDYRSKALRADVAIEAGSIGGKVMRFAWRRAGLPPRLLPMTPLGVPAMKARWGRDTGLDLQATVKSGTGATIDADVAWKPGKLDVRSVRLRDHETDATIGVAMRGRFLDVRFAGKLKGRSVESLLKADNGKGTGSLSGEVRATFDRDLRGHTTVDGRVEGAAIDLGWLIDKPVVVEKISMTGEGGRLHFDPLTVRWGEQTATLRGEVRRTAEDLIVNADVDSPGVLVDALLAAGDTPAAPADQPPTDPADLLDEPVAATPSKRSLWPLPFSGTLNLRAGFVEYQGYRVEPVAAQLVLEHDHAHLNATKAAVCGISFPFVVDLTPGGVIASVVLDAKDQQLEATAKCLSDQRVLITGTFDLRADLRTQGRRGELLGNLAGTLEARAHDGEIRKFALLGNILSLKNVTKVFSRGTPDFGGAGFHYAQMTASATIGNGNFTVDQSALDSDAMGLVASGTIGLRDRKANLTVLVAPFGSLDKLVRRVPVFGYVIGGTLTSIPVGVSGDIANPLVVPLGPSAVTTQLLGVFERTLKLPGKMLAPLQNGASPPAPAK